MKRKNVLTALVASSLLFATASLQAQDESPPNIADLWIVTVDYPNSAAFEEVFKAHLAVRKEVGDPRDWQMYTVIAGGEMDTYWIRYCCIKWADADAYSEWSLSSGVGDHWEEHVSQYVDDYDHRFQNVDLENSNWPEDRTDDRYFGVTTWRLKPGTTGARQAAIKALSAVGKEHGWSRPWSWQYYVGGDAGLALVTPYANFADMEPPEQSFFEFATEHLGAEETARLFHDFGSSFWSSEYTIFAHRPDLSMGDGED